MTGTDTAHPFSGRHATNWRLVQRRRPLSSRACLPLTPSSAGMEWLRQDLEVTFANVSSTIASLREMVKMGGMPQVRGGPRRGSGSRQLLLSSSCSSSLQAARICYCHIAPTHPRTHPHPHTPHQ